VKANPAKRELLRRIAIRFLIAAFSAGWLLPIWLSADCFLSFVNAEIWPRLNGEHPINSFTYIRFVTQAFTVGIIWLAAVVFFWAWRLAGPGKRESTVEP
jgi:hypothetical protein